jgi:hypothetical protein
MAIFNILKTVPVYVKVYTDRMDITRLDTGESLSRAATEKFSNTRLVVANFNIADEFARNMIRELLKSGAMFQSQLKMLIQQMEKLEGGVSEVEKRVLRDLGERCGAKLVMLAEETRELSGSEALQRLE